MLAQKTADNDGSRERLEVSDSPVEQADEHVVRNREWKISNVRKIIV